MPYVYIHKKPITKEIFYVGIGKTLYSGHPAANHTEKAQAPFWQSYQMESPIPILNRGRDYRVAFLGYYRVDNIHKKLANEGFTYFEIELRRITDRLPRSVTECPSSRASATRHALSGYRCRIIDNLFDKGSSKGITTRNVK
jgi:hypothetical protein